MAALLVRYFVLLYFGVIACSTLSDAKITWPQEYHFKVEVLDFKTSLKSSMEIWYSSKFNRSCIDVPSIKKTYYAPNTFPHMVQPISNEHNEDEVVCIQDNFDDVYKSAINFLPDASIFEDSGKLKYFNDKRVRVWRAVNNVHEDWWSMEVLYVLKTTEYNIPVRYEYKLYNVVNGSVLKHHIRTYYDFNDNVTEQDVTLANFNNCKKKTEYAKQQKDSFTLLHPDVPSDLDSAFGRYKDAYNKKYNGKEHAVRKHIFENNWRMIIDHNLQNLTYKLRINQFADKTEDELRSRYGAYPFEHPGLQGQPFPHTPEEIKELVKHLPVYVNLTSKGVISRVKDQGHCRSCWAFATTAAVEGVIARFGGSPVLELSEQALIDCSRMFGYSTDFSYRNDGCHGGWIGPSMDYIKDPGIPLEWEYTYQGAKGICNSSEMNTVYKIKGYVLVPPNQPDAMKVAIDKYGPVAVTMRIEEEKFKHYGSGIYKSQRPYPSCNKFRINHAVTLVGYGVMNGEEYWIAKNSYGKLWGQDGYVLLSAAKENCFLTLNEPYYPIW